MSRQYEEICDKVRWVFSLMKLGPVLLVLLLVGCVSTETTSIHVQVDRQACPSPISSLSLLVIALELAGRCTLARGDDSAGAGTVALPPFTGARAEVAALALAYGGDADGGADLADGPRGDKDGAPKNDRVGPAPDVPGPLKCGNGICDKSLGETCKTCPKDCGPCDYGPPLGDQLLPKPDALKKDLLPLKKDAWVKNQDAAPPWVDGSASFGLGQCVRCYGLTRVALGVASHTLKLVVAPGCKVPDGAAQQAGLPAVPLPPPGCR